MVPNFDASCFGYTNDLSMHIVLVTCNYFSFVAEIKVTTAVMNISLIMLHIIMQYSIE